MTRLHDVVDSPIGPLTLVVDDGELCGLWMDPVPDRQGPERLGTRSAGVAARAAAQLEEYFAGGRTTFDLPLRMGGSAFQRSVWDLLCTIPYGETRTYGELAAELGRPGAARAVGLANGSNPISVIVPCHRVIGADGSLTGYGGGLERKRTLLDHERARRQPKLFG